MSLTRFRSYKPGEKSYSRRRTEEEWQPFHSLLSEMHAQRYTRKEMLIKLKDVGFEVSPGQLLSQMKKWDLMVYGERVSHSGIQPSSDGSPDLQTPEPLILSDTLLNEPQHLEGKFILPDLPPVPPLSLAGPVSHVRQFSGDQSFDDISDAISFSTMDDAQDIQTDPNSEQLPVTDDCPSYPRWDRILEPVMHALGSDAADPSSILRQIPTITEPWCGNFPTTCCCQALFRGHGGFKNSPELYKIILEQSSPRSLKYIVALLNLVETKSLGEDKQDLRILFWDAVDYYLQLCTRIYLKNKLAPHILHRLLDVWEVFSDGNGHLPFPTTDLFRSSAANTHDSLINKILRTKPSMNFPSSSLAHQVDWHIEAERDVGCVVGFTVRRPSTFPLLNYAGEVFGSTESWNNLGHTADQPKSITDLVSTANQIAAYMQAQWYNGISITTAHDLGDCDVPLIFTALGLMIALETTSFTSEADLTDPESWTPGLQAFIETTINTLSLNADYADKFRKAYWLVRCEHIGHKGKAIHMGEPCTATHAWEILERNIHDYDEERTWFERRFFSGRNNTWPQANDLITTAEDNVSIRSGNSFNSFQKFQALALHLKIGTPASGSLKTKSSSRKSRASSVSHMSWQLEQMLHIRDDVEDDGTHETETVNRDSVAIPDVEQRTRMDELAFQKMQAIVE